MVNLDDVQSALSPVSGALDADGYRLALTLEPENGLRVVISAGPEACEDCLVPKSLMEQMIGSALQGAGLPALDLHVVYPVEGHGATAH
jgi:hypothetical protein